MTEQEFEKKEGPKLKDAEDPELYKDVGSDKLPIQKMLSHSKAGNGFHLTMKNVRIMGGAKFPHAIIEQASKGGGEVEFVVGASRWKVRLTFDDLEFEEKRGFILGI